MKNILKFIISAVIVLLSCNQDEKVKIIHNDLTEDINIFNSDQLLKNGNYVKLFTGKKNRPLRGEKYRENIQIGKISFGSHGKISNYETLEKSFGYKMKQNYIYNVKNRVVKCSVYIESKLFVENEYYYNKNSLKKVEQTFYNCDLKKGRKIRQIIIYYEYKDNLIIKKYINKKNNKYPVTEYLYLGEEKDKKIYYDPTDLKNLLPNVLCERQIIRKEIFIGNKKTNKSIETVLKSI